MPPPLRERFLEARRAVDVFTPSLYQLALAEFLREGHYVRHLRRMHAVYLERRHALLDGLARHCGDMLRVQNADGGLHVTVLLAEGIDDRRVVERLGEHGLVAMTLSDCFIGAPRRSGLLLGFGTSQGAKLFDATRVLGDVLRSVQRDAARPSRRAAR